MSEVYLAYDEKLHKQIAIKILPDDLAQNSTYISRFEREAAVGRKIVHPNVVRCIESGQDAATGRRFLVMEYVKGQSAQNHLERSGPLPLAEATQVVVDIARGLEELHHRGFVHRDVKPGNILIAEDGRAKLADLGVAKALGDNVDLTSFDQGIGTPFYMPWEQSLNASIVDPRSDLFALGATYYHMITGHVPFPGNDVAEVAAKKDLGSFIPAREINDKLPRSVDSILAKLMSRAPTERFQTATQLIEALRASGLTGEKEVVSQLVETELPPAVTRPDLKSAKKPSPKARKNEQVWTYQYRHGSGWKRGKARTQDIVHLYEDGILPDEFFVAAKGQKTCRDFRTVPEFRELKRKSPAPAASPSPVVKKRQLDYGRVAAILGTAVVLTAAASLVFHLVFGGS
jgi:serine/threonine protein kinase